MNGLDFSQYERPRLARFVARIVGRERFARWDVEPERCSYTSPLDHLPCVRDSGHSGLCVTERVRTDSSTGRSFTTRDSWYGINFKEEDDS